MKKLLKKAMSMTLIMVMVLSMSFGMVGLQNAKDAYAIDFTQPAGSGMDLSEVIPADVNETGYSYDVSDDVLTIKSGNYRITGESDSRRIEINSGATTDDINIKFDDVTIGEGGYENADFAPIIITGLNTHVIIWESEAVFEAVATSGILVENGAQLTFENSNITATGERNGAGIAVVDDAILTIGQDCVIKAEGGDYGAGIGGEKTGDCGEIYIQGGQVNAIGGEHASGIGAGNKSDNVVIFISGGRVTAEGGVTGIGAGQQTNNVTTRIIGGTVNARVTKEDSRYNDIGAYSTNPSQIKTFIGGGSVNANRIYPAPKKADNTLVYLTKVKLIKHAGNAPTAVTVEDDDDFGSEDIYSDSDGYVYLYLRAVGTAKRLTFEETQDGENLLSALSVARPQSAATYLSKEVIEIASMVQTGVANTSNTNMIEVAFTKPLPADVTLVPANFVVTSIANGPVPAGLIKISSVTKVNSQNFNLMVSSTDADLQKSVIKPGNVRILVTGIKDVFIGNAVPAFRDLTIHTKKLIKVTAVQVGGKAKKTPSKSIKVTLTNVYPGYTPDLGTLTTAILKNGTTKMITKYAKIAHTAGTGIYTITLTMNKKFKGKGSAVMSLVPPAGADYVFTVASLKVAVFGKK